MKTTKWIPGSINPVHVGMYEVRNNRLMDRRYKGYLTGSKFRYWNGKRWMCAGPGSVFGDTTSIMGTHDSHEWRGLKVKP